MESELRMSPRNCCREAKKHKISTLGMDRNIFFSRECPLGGRLIYWDASCIRLQWLLSSVNIIFVKASR